MKTRLVMEVVLKLRDHKSVPDKTKYTRKTRREAKKELRHA